MPHVNKQASGHTEAPVAKVGLGLRVSAGRARRHDEDNTEIPLLTERPTAGGEILLLMEIAG